MEVRGDAWKLLKFKQRPFPVGVEDIGTWQSIFEIMVAASVVSNSALIVFTMQLLSGYSFAFRFWIFVGFQWVLFACQYALASSVPDTPVEVEIQLERQDFVGRKLIAREPEEALNDVAAVTTRESFSVTSILDTFPSSLKSDYE